MCAVYSNDIWVSLEGDVRVSASISLSPHYLTCMLFVVISLS